MYIPVSIGNGLTSISCTATSSGTFQAGCAVTHNGTVYPSNSQIQVKIHDILYLTANITEYANIPIKLGERTYNWRVDTPKISKYLNSLSDVYTRGTAYGKVTVNGQDRPFVEAGSVSDSDEILTVIDATKNIVWIFGLSGGTKRLAVPERPVSVVFAPKWSSDAEEETIGYIVTESFVYPMIGNSSIDIDAAIRVDVHGRIVAADADSNGIVACSASATIKLVNGTITKLSGIGGSAIQSTYKNDVIVGTDDGRLILLQSSLGYAERVLSARRNVDGDIVSVPSIFQIDTNHANYIFAVDMANRQLLSISAIDFSVNLEQLEGVPSSIVSNQDNVYIGYYTKSGVERRSVQLELKEVIPTSSPKLVNYTDSLTTTNLYENAAILSDEFTETLKVEVVDLGITENRGSSLVVPWTRPAFVRALDEAQIKVNGYTFTEGYIAYPDVLEISAGMDGIYYSSIQIDFIGDRAVSAYYRTKPKLIPDKVVLGSVYDAFVKYTYEDSFVVSGVSDGFYAPIKADIKELTFSINGGEYVQQGNVTNGDIVTVRTYIKSLVTSRDQHNIVAEEDESVVSEWTLLAMQLNGSSVMEETNKDSSRFDILVFEADSSSTSNDTSKPILEPESETSFQGMYASSSISYQTIVSVDYECDALLASLPMTGSMQSYCQHCNTSESSVGSASLSYSQTYFDGVLFGNTYTKFDIEVSQGLFTVSDNNELLGETIAYVSSVSNCMLLPTTYYTYESSALYLDALFNVQSSNEPHVVVVPYERFSTAERDSTTQVEVAVQSKDRNFVVLGYVRLSSNQVNFTSQAYVAKTSHCVLNAAEISLSHQNQGAVVSESNPIRTGYTISQGEVVSEVRAINEPASGLITVELASESNLIEGAFVFAVRDEHVLEAVRPVVGVFALADHEVDDSENLNTLDQVNSYVDSLNLETTSQVSKKTHNGKWIFVSAPIADNALCPISSASRPQQRRFGYAGGG